MRPPKFPVVTEAGQILAHMPRKFALEQLTTAYQTTGGQERLVHEMNKNSEGWWKGFDAMVKLQPKDPVDAGARANTPEELWERLDRREEERARARAGDGPNVIDVTPED